MRRKVECLALVRVVDVEPVMRNKQPCVANFQGAVGNRGVLIPEDVAKEPLN